MEKLIKPNKAILKSRLYDLGFIFCYITAQIYHYFEYLDDAATGLILFIFLMINLFLVRILNQNIKDLKPIKLKNTILKFHLFFILLLLFLLTQLLFEWPYTANHSNYNTFIILILLGIYAKEYLESKSLNLNLKKNNKFLLHSIVIVYFCAALHKMNFDFFNSFKSCANWYHVKFFKRFISSAQIEQIPEFIRYISPRLVGLIEIIAPFALLVGRLRKVGIYLLVFLHSYLALGGFSDFSALAMSILFLYFPEAKYNFKNWFNKTKIYIYSSLLIIGICLIGYYFVPGHKQQLQTAQGLILISFIFYMLDSKNKSSLFYEPQKYKLKSLDGFIYILIFILLLFGLSPYFGLRSGGSFTMFSNLRIVGPENNHFFIKKIDLFGLEKEIYQVQKTTHEDIFLENRTSTDWITKSGLQLAYKKAVSRGYKTKINLQLKDINGSIIKLDPESLKTFLGPQKNILFYKLYMYSYLADKGRDNSCRW